MVAKKRKKVKWKINFNKKKIADYFFLFLSIVLVLFLAFSCFNIYQKQKASDKNLKVLSSEIDALEKERNLLNFTLGETYSEEYLEKVAREDLGMQKPGEKIFIIKKDFSIEEENDIVEKGFLERVKNWFSNIFKLPE